MPIHREHPYIWATWLAKLLAGQDQCEWAGWFRAHYQDWTKPPSDFDSAQWMLNHTALLNRERERLEELGHTIYVENQNSFRLRGRYATLAGKPDLIAVNNLDAVIIDAKTGRPNPHHTVQVMIYQYAVPLALPPTKVFISQVKSRTPTPTSASPPQAQTANSCATWDH